MFTREEVKKALIDVDLTQGDVARLGVTPQTVHTVTKQPSHSARVASRLLEIIRQAQLLNHPIKQAS